MILAEPPMDILSSLLETNRLSLNAAWLIKLRWVAVVGQLITVGVVVGVIGVPAPVIPLISLIAVTAASNAALMGWLRAEGPHEDDRLLVGVMLLDLLLLTGLLYFSGGPANPFSIFFLVNLALAALLLPAASAWLLTGSSILCFTLLILTHRPLPEVEPVDLRPLLGPDRWRWPNVAQQGLWVAYTACSTVIVYFVARLRDELRRVDRQLREAEQARARAEKLEALGTLAAGAAHELSTPLSTIAVAARELERSLDAAAVDAELHEDLSLIRSELERCRSILDRMSLKAGHSVAESPAPIRVADLAAEATAGLPRGVPVELRLEDEVADMTVSGLTIQLGQALRGLVKNAIDATLTADRQAPVEVRAAAVGDQADPFVLVEIRDAGAGMSPETAARAGEPFFTTKPPGEGMGLGLFLAHSVIARGGGRLEIDSQPGLGSVVRVWLPRIHIAAPAPASTAAG